MATEQVLVLIVDANWGPHCVIRYPCFSSLTEKPSTSPQKIPSETRDLSFKDMVVAMCLFIRAYEITAESRRLAIIAMNSNRCEIIYKERGRNHFIEATDPTRFDDITTKLFSFLEEEQNIDGKSMLATSFSIGLCYLNKIKKESPNVEGHLLLLDASSKNQYSSQYITLMNSAFTASKNGILLDTCALGTSPSTIPEQLVDITGGVYIPFMKGLNAQIQLDLTMALSELLLFHFLPSKNLRNVISAIKHQDRTNNAVCFCHHKAVDTCSVCSCCLAIFCSEIDESTKKERTHCQVCGARFTRYTIQQKTTGNVLF